MTINRRDFLKRQSLFLAAASSPLTVKAQGLNLVASDNRIDWNKAPCRFCGTGCSLLVGTQNGEVVGTYGDPDGEVNRGLACVKGYNAGNILYGEDRLSSPMLRMANGVYDKNSEFTPVSWDRAFDEMEIHFKRALKEKGIEARLKIRPTISYSGW